MYDDGVHSDIPTWILKTFPPISESLRVELYSTHLGDFNCAKFTHAVECMRDMYEQKNSEGLKIHRIA